MNMQQELAAERKAKEELLNRVSVLEVEMKAMVVYAADLSAKLTESRIIIFNRIVQLENLTRKLA